MKRLEAAILEFEDLAQWTRNFSEENYIGRFQYGKLYRTSLRDAEYIVKIWDVPEIYEPNDNELRQMEETTLLRHEMWTHCPGMVEMGGYCCDGEHLCAVYMLKSKPLDSVFNLIPKNDFSWLQRVKAALGLAYLLKVLHAKHNSFYKPFVVNNLDAAHLVLDEDYNIYLCDFGWITGGVFPERRSCSGQDIVGCYGYTDIGSGAPYVYEWARRESEAFESESNKKDTGLSLVHENLTVEDGFCGFDGYKITKLALRCVNRVQSRRPNMEEVYESLRKLEVVTQRLSFWAPVKVIVDA